MVLGVVVSGIVETGLYRVSPVSGAGLLKGNVSAVGSAELLNSVNRSETEVLKTVSTFVVVESTPASGKSPASFVPTK